MKCPCCGQEGAWCESSNRHMLIEQHDWCGPCTRRGEPLPNGQDAGTYLTRNVIDHAGVCDCDDYVGEAYGPYGDKDEWTPSVRDRVKSKWNAGRARVAKWIYPGIFECDCEEM